jgi:DNA polymerase III delta prime subunit
MSVAKSIMLEEMHKNELRKIAENEFVKANSEELDTIAAAMLKFEQTAEDLGIARFDAKLKMLRIPKNASAEWIINVLNKVGDNLPLKGIEKYQTAFSKAEAELYRLKKLYEEKE